jgi:hypothetical protein
MIRFETLAVVRCEVLTAVSMNMAVFWVVGIVLTMQAASTSETSVNFYQSTRRSSPQDSHLHTCRRENLQSYFTQ